MEPSVVQQTVWACVNDKPEKAFWENALSILQSEENVPQRHTDVIFWCGNREQLREMSYA